MTITRRYFNVRVEAHRKLRCALCGQLMSTGDAAVSVTEPNATHMEHDDACPPARPAWTSDPDKRIIQGSKP